MRTSRITALLVLAVMMAVMLVAGAGNAFALANSEQGTVTEQAEGNCEANLVKQRENEVAAGGGPKEDIDVPLNCDHFFQSEGLIGVTGEDQ